MIECVQQTTDYHRNSRVLVYRFKRRFVRLVKKRHISTTKKQFIMADGWSNIVQ
jgi:hypothetical protein